MPFPKWTPPKVSDEPTEPGWGAAGDLRRSLEVLNQSPPTPQEQRIAELEAALRALTAVEPIATRLTPHDADTWDAETCIYCLRYATSANGYVVEHAPDCPWVTAKALLPEAP